MYLIILDKYNAKLEKRKKFLDDIKQKLSLVLKFITLSPSKVANKLCKIHNNDLDKGFSDKFQYFCNYLLNIYLLSCIIMKIKLLLKKRNISNQFPYIVIVL